MRDREKQRAIEQLQGLKYEDPETAHFEADRILLYLINDPDIESAWSAIPKWYA